MWQFSTKRGLADSTLSCSDYEDCTFCAHTPYICSSVGYCIVYSLRVRHNLQLDRRNRLHTFFLKNNPIVQESDGKIEIAIQFYHEKITSSTPACEYILAATSLVCCMCMPALFGFRLFGRRLRNLHLHRRHRDRL